MTSRYETERNSRHETPRPTRYDIGDQVRLAVVFEAENGVPTDPTVVVCRYRRPSGDVTVLEYGLDEGLTQETTGSYYVDVVVDVAGTWVYRWEGTGSLTAAAEGSFVVQRSAFT